MLTLLEIAKLNGRDKEVGLIEENLTHAPEVAVVPARPIKGTSYKATIRTDLPGGGGFRGANEGVTSGKSKHKEQLVQCFIYSRLIEADLSVLNAGEDDSEEALMSSEEVGAVLDAFINLGKQFYYGKSVDAKGFPGLATMVNSALELDAEGTAPAKGSSVYGVKLGIKNVHFVFGNDKTLAFAERWKQSVESEPGKKFAALCSNLDAWMGLANGSKYSVGRIKDLTEEEGKTLNDRMVAALLAKYPVGGKPDRLFMTRRSAFQLQSSRSTTTNATGEKSATGKENFAPMPTESNGVPIVVTDSIKDDEALS